MSLPLPPHGGVSNLVERAVTAERAAELKTQTADAPRIVVTDADLSTVRRFGDGALTPLKGPMTRDVYNRVLDNAHILVNGEKFAWGIPLSLPVTNDERAKLALGKPALLVDERGEAVAVLDVEDIFDWDKKNKKPQV
jgi:sulfate adenylyltransferase